jgi:hypothetical protein
MIVFYESDWNPTMDLQVRVQSIYLFLCIYCGVGS